MTQVIDITLQRNATYITRQMSSRYCNYPTSCIYKLNGTFRASSIDNITMNYKSTSAYIYQQIMEFITYLLLNLTLKCGQFLNIPTKLS